MAHRFALFLAHIALGALLALSISGQQGDSALDRIALDRSSGTALLFGVSPAEFCADEIGGHADCPLCRLEADAVMPVPGHGPAQAAVGGVSYPLPRDLALCKRARDATVQARAPPLA